MKLVGKRGLSGLLEAAMLVLMVVALVLMLTLHLTIPWITGKTPGDASGNYYFEKYFVVLIISGILAELVLWQGRGILHNINQNRPFCKDMVRRLRILGAECLSIALFYSIAVFFVSKVFSVVVLVTFTVVGLMLLIFSELFRQASNYKEENDMTI